MSYPSTAFSIFGGNLVIKHRRISWQAAGRSTKSKKERNAVWKKNIKVVNWKWPQISPIYTISVYIYAKEIRWCNTGNGQGNGNKSKKSSLNPWWEKEGLINQLSNILETQGCRALHWPDSSSELVKPQPPVPVGSMRDPGISCLFGLMMMRRGKGDRRQQCLRDDIYIYIPFLWAARLTPRATLATYTVPILPFSVFNSLTNTYMRR